MIGRKLKAARVLKGLTQVEMAKRMACNRTNVAQIESRASVQTKTLETYARILGMTIRDIHTLGEGL